jgi:trimethylamine---corrinoid protein Co-methyltransferase
VSQMAKFYDVPSCIASATATCCQSHQLMAHLGSTHVFSSMMNVCEIGGAGALEGAAQFSLEALVLNDEIRSFSKRITQGIDINEDTLAVEAIAAAAKKGEYVSSPHTMKHLRKENRFKPNLIDWQPYEIWAEDAKTIIDRAHERTRKLIDTYQVPPLDESIQQELDKVVQIADQELG